MENVPTDQEISKVLAAIRAAHENGQFNNETTTESEDKILAINEILVLFTTTRLVKGGSAGPSITDCVKSYFKQHMPILSDEDINTVIAVYFYSLANRILLPERKND